MSAATDQCLTLCCTASIGRPTTFHAGKGILAEQNDGHLFTSHYIFSLVTAATAPRRGQQQMAEFYGCCRMAESLRNGRGLNTETSNPFLQRNSNPSAPWPSSGAPRCRCQSVPVQRSGRRPASAPREQQQRMPPGKRQLCSNRIFFKGRKKQMNPPPLTA